MTCILTPNLNPPFNLRRIHPNPDLFKVMSPEDAIAYVVARNKQTGVIPCETEEERDACLALHTLCHPAMPAIDLPPIGVHYIVDERDLPGGSISDENDYFFDAWEWVDGCCQVNMSKARVVHMERIRIVRNEELVRVSGSKYRQPPEIEAMFTPERRALLQTLRDIPQTFDLARFTTPPELMKTWPEGLPRREGGP